MAKPNITNPLNLVGTHIITATASWMMHQNKLKIEEGLQETSAPWHPYFLQPPSLNFGFWPSVPTTTLTISVLITTDLRIHLAQNKATVYETPQNPGTEKYSYQQFCKQRQNPRGEFDTALDFEPVGKTRLGFKIQLLILNRGEHAKTAKPF